MITRYELQPIDHATVSIFYDNGAQSFIIEPEDGYKIRENNDNTYSTMQVGIPMQFSSLLNKYHAVPIDEPDEAIEEEDNAQSTDNEEISAEEALSIIIGGTDDDQS